jgi:hypothetical protein
MLYRRNARRAALFTAVMLAAIPAAPAFAAEGVDPAAVMARACMGRVGEISEGNLATALLIEAGKDPAAWVSDQQISSVQPTSVSDLFNGALLRRLHAVRSGVIATPEAEVQELNRAMADLEEGLRHRAHFPDSPLSIEGTAPTGAFLFAAETHPWILKCAPPTQPPTSPLEEAEDVPTRGPLSIRATPEELALVGDERNAAGAFALSLDRTRTVLEDGSQKTVTNLKVNGTVGYRLFETDSLDVGYLFGRYELAKSRTRPTPALPAGTSEGDGDTDAFEAGMVTRFQLVSDDAAGFGLFTSGRAGLVFDFAKHAKRINFDFLLRPAWTKTADGRGWDGNLGICGLGHTTDGIPARCDIQLELLGAGVIERGTTKLGNFDTLIAGGARVEYELFLPTGEKSEVAASVKYRLLHVFHGALSRIERLEISLKHRFWTDDGIGFDLGFTYSRGTNELSLENENILGFGFGVIY